MATVHFTSSDAFMEADPKAAEHAEVEIVEYIEGTYNSLRTGPDGNEIAWYKEGEGGIRGWELNNGQRFSDWAVKV